MGKIYNCGKMCMSEYTLMDRTPRFDELKVGDYLEIVIPFKESKVISKTDKFVSIAYRDNGSFKLIVYEKSGKRLLDYDELIVKENSQLEKRIEKIFIQK
ncbi:MAG: hypothetical protein KKF67_00620 [Nanoarchaeota archaeon]|nr:hypothetical protein [Nanoarchaeota archaeon]